MTFDFAHAGSVKLQVPVEPQPLYWSTFSPPAPVPRHGRGGVEATATPVTSATPTSHVGVSATPTATPTRSTAP